MLHFLFLIVLYYEEVSCHLFLLPRYILQKGDIPALSPGAGSFPQLHNAAEMIKGLRQLTGGLHFILHWDNEHTGKGCKAPSFPGTFFVLQE